MKALKEGPFLPRFGKPGEVTLIGGRAATGKSSLVLHLILKRHRKRPKAGSRSAEKQTKRRRPHRQGSRPVL